MSGWFPVNIGLRQMSPWLINVGVDVNVWVLGRVRMV